MCTVITLATEERQHFFGRSMDIECTFNQRVIFLPRQFKWTNAVTQERHDMTYALIGMGTVMQEHPLFAEAMNEKGLACAGLNFPNYAFYEETIQTDQENIGPYDMILWLLSQFTTIKEVRDALQHVWIVGKPFMEGVPLATLHWILTDATGESIVIEKTKEGLKVFDNTIGVLTNAPTFDWHLTNIRNYMGLTSEQPITTTWGEHKLQPMGQGVGLMGLPGDFTPSARFVRAAYLRNHLIPLETEAQAVSECFHILDNVSMVSGAVIIPSGVPDRTIYTSCMDQQKGIYYYKTHTNNQINAIDMHKEYLDGNELKCFAYPSEQCICYQN